MKLGDARFGAIRSSAQRGFSGRNNLTGFLGGKRFKEGSHGPVPDLSGNEAVHRHR